MGVGVTNNWTKTVNKPGRVSLGLRQRITLSANCTNSSSLYHAGRSLLRPCLCGTPLLFFANPLFFSFRTLKQKSFRRDLKDRILLLILALPSFWNRMNSAHKKCAFLSEDINCLPLPPFTHTISSIFAFLWDWESLDFHRWRGNEEKRVKNQKLSCHSFSFFFLCPFPCCWRRLQLLHVRYYAA